VSERERYSAIVEYIDVSEAQERLEVWADLLVSLGLADKLGAYIALESGSGWLIKVATHSGQPLTVVVDELLGIPRQENEGEA
jgi:hypothetical protein